MKNPFAQLNHPNTKLRTSILKVVGLSCGRVILLVVKFSTASSRGEAAGYLERTGM